MALPSEAPPESPTTNPPPRNGSHGWDGKLRVEKKAIITNPESLSDPEYSDEDAPPVEQIDADEGTSGKRIWETADMAV